MKASGLQLTEQASDKVSCCFGSWPDITGEASNLCHISGMTANNTGCCRSLPAGKFELQRLTVNSRIRKIAWYHLSLRCCSALANEKVPSASTPSNPCWLSQRDSFCHQRVFTDESWVKAFLTSLTEGNSLSLLTYLSTVFSQCNCNGTLPSSHKTMPSGTGLAVPEMKTKNSEDVCHQDPTLSSGTALQKERACLQLQASRLPL